MSILVVGSVAYDGLETPSGSRPRILGGSASYISLTASYFSDTVRLVGVVGHDFDPADRARFTERGIDLEGLQTDASGKTFFWAGKYHDDLNNRDTLVTELNVFEQFQPVIPEAHRDSRIVCLGNIAPALQLSVLDQVRKPEWVILDTMNFWITGALADLKAVLERVDVFILNDQEARQLSGESNLIRAAAAISAMGPKHLVIKKGEHGALLFSGDDVFSAPAFPLGKLTDPTGAGDTFLGGFAGWLSRVPQAGEADLRRAVAYGSVMASFCVEEFGPERLFDLTPENIDARFEAFRRLSWIP